MFKEKKILLCITGSIAAYKAILLVRLLVKAGAEVKVIVTPAARDFVSPLTISTLSKNEVLGDLALNESWANHVMLGRWADIMVIAPLSCNTLAKMANGICDNLLMAVYLSATCPVVVAPAMDEDMWLHPSVKNNIKTIAAYGNLILSVTNGELASGLCGEGRMAEPEIIMECLRNYFLTGTSLLGKKAMVTAGPTYEHLDPVRFIGNHSTGKMGIAIANELKNRGAEVTLIIGPTSLPIPSFTSVIKVTTAEEMFNASLSVFKEMDIAVLSAAVADYAPINIETEKIKKSGENISIEFRKTKDILKHLGQIKKSNQLLVGFALETNNEEMFAKKKLVEKNADMIVLNSLNDSGAGFGYDTNKITIFDKLGNLHAFEKKSKAAVAKDIVNVIVKL